MLRVVTNKGRDIYSVIMPSISTCLCLCRMARALNLPSVMVLGKGVLKSLHTAKATLISACRHRIGQQRSNQRNYTHGIELGVISHPGFVKQMLSTPANKNTLLFPYFCYTHGRMWTLRS